MNVSPTYTYKKLNYLFNIEDTFTSGIMLEGWEVKSLQNYFGDINVSYCQFNKNQLILKNCKITPQHNHIFFDSIEGKENQDRILLLNKSELKKIRDFLKIQGHTCIPSKLYRNSKGLWKIDICLVSGKNKRDKRDNIRRKDLERELKRKFK